MTRPRGWIARIAVALTATALVSLAGAATADGGFAGRNGDIAFDSLRTGDWDLFVMKADGSDERRLDASAVGATDARPAWAPDPGVGANPGGEQYPGGFDIFPFTGPVGQRVGLFGIGLNHMPLQQIVVLIAWPGDETNPDWSPDGRTIAFESDAAGQQDI
jgi:TolB protein